MTEDTVPWWHLFHRWSKWSEMQVTKSGAGVQTKQCLICHKTEVRFL